MRITHIALKNFIRFRLCDIKLLEIDISSDVQNVIGTNGSGKSSLLRELNPRPASRSDYGEGGYKHIHLLHDGSEFKLSSDFSNTGSPHSFIKDGTELNHSGTTPLQEELVRRELGYTPQVHNLCYGLQPLSAIRVGLRESYLLNIHPCRMSLLLERHKVVEQKLRGFRSNLSLLYERRTALASQLLDAPVRDDLQTENSRLTNDLAILIGAIHKLTNQRQNLTVALREHPKPHPPRPKAERLQAKRGYPHYGQIDRQHDLDMTRRTISDELSSSRTELDGCVRQIRAIVVEIDRYEDYIRRSDSQGALDTLEQTLQTLRADIATLQDNAFEKPFDQFLIDEIPNHISRLADMIAIFIGYNAPIPTMREVQSLQVRFERDKHQLTLCEHDETQTLERLSRVEVHLRERVLESIPDGCHSCILFQQYTTTVKRLQDDHAVVDTELKRIRKRKAWFAYRVEKRGARLESFNQIVPQMQRLQSYLNDHKFLLISLQGMDILDTLRRNPSMLVIRVQSHYDRSRTYYQCLKKQDELVRRTADYERLKTPSEYGRQFLDTMVQEKRSELMTLKTTHAEINRTISEKMSLIDTLSEFTTELGRLEQDKIAFNQLEVIESLQFDLGLCDRYLKMLETCKTTIVTRLADIDRVLREQDSHQSRYLEVASTIAVVELQQQEFSDMERAQSPTKGIPYRYMVRFINDLVSVSNPFINRVFSYPFEFASLTEGDPLDYKFKMRIGDDVAPDVSLCSEAQMDFADLAFRLAQIEVLHQNNYPLYLDECDKSFDHAHKQKLLLLLKSLISEKIVGQLFMVNHNPVLYNGIPDAEVLVLNTNNIVVPDVYNQHVRIEHT